MSIAASHSERALASEKAGDRAAASTAWERAVAAAPDDWRMANSAGVAHLRMGQPDVAARLFERAASMAGGNLDPTMNWAIALGRVGQHSRAAATLRAVETNGKGEARYWSARGNAERLSHDAEAAEKSYERALALEPRHSRALHGRAEVAKERSAADAVSWFDRALQANPQSADIWLGKAGALDDAGEHQAAREIAEQLVAQVPHWTAALSFLAQLRLAAGEDNFTDHFEVAISKSDPAQAASIYTAWSKALGGLDFFAEAADVAARARRDLAEDPGFALFEATFAGMDGQVDRAEAIFSQHRDEGGDWRVQNARHDIRMGRIERAETALSSLIEGGDRSVNLWALRDVCWRLTGDPRHEWLHGQNGLVNQVEVGDRDLLARVVELLRGLHRTAALPIGQSVRGGTQTRGRLFHRDNADLAALKTALLEALGRYQAELPPEDQSHPSLVFRNGEWVITHSWSVRLTGAGFHTSHIHPLGVLSSALYLVVPEGVGGTEKAGHLELGRPPPDLGTDLAPLSIIEPKPGTLALFPSTLFHGTRPFDEGERLTVAFDVNVGEDR